MGKFCVMRFMENYDELQSKAFLLKNKKFRDTYIKKFNPFKVESLVFDNLFDYEGVLVTLPITYNDAINDNEMLELLISKTSKFLLNQDVNIILYDKVFLKSDAIASLEHLDIGLFFVKDILFKVIKYNGFSRKDVNISVITGDYDKTCIALNDIYSELNFITLVNEDAKFNEFEEITDMIFCDSGLEISFSKNCRDSDIIINLNNNPNSIIKNIKNNTLIIDLIGTVDTKLTKNQVIKNFSVKFEDKYISDYELELILYAYFINYRLYKNNTNKISKFSNTKRDIIASNIRFNSYKVHR